MIIQILMIISGLALVGVGIWHFVMCHNCKMIEMTAQIAQYGFYKSDVVILQDNYCWSIALLVGAVLLLILGGVLLLIGSVWLSDKI